MKKKVSVLFTFVSLALFFAICNISYAADKQIEIDSQTSNIVISGNLASDVNNQVTITIVDSENNIIWIGEESIENGVYFAKTKLNVSEPETCRVMVNNGNTDVTESAIVEVIHDKKFDSNLGFLGTEYNTWFNEDDVFNIKLKLQNLYADETDYKLFVAQYDENERLLGITSDDYSIGFNRQGNHEISKIENCTMMEGAQFAKAFAWTSDGLIPLANVIKRAPGDSTYQDGDVVALTGDSITEVSAYVMLLEHFYQTRYPERNITFYNKGISGNRAEEILNRFEFDVLAENPNKVVIMDGFNDESAIWKDEDFWKSEDLESKMDATAQRPLKNFQLIIDKAKNRGIEFTICTPNYLDEVYGKYPNPEGCQYNRYLTIFSDKLKGLAKANNINCFDTNGVTNEFASIARAKGITGMVLNDGDRVHPYWFNNTGGSYALMYGIIKGQNASDTVAEVNIDVTGNRNKLVNCSISDLSATTENISYTYSPKAIPLAYTSQYKTIEKYLDFSTLCNREIISASGLSDGTYTVSMDGAALGEYTAAELSQGINISTNDNNPNQKRSLESFGYIMYKRGDIYPEVLAESDLIHLRSTQYRPLIAGYDPYDLVGMKEYYENKNPETAEEDYQVYVNALADEETCKQNMALYAGLAREAAKPQSVSVVISKN